MPSRASAGSAAPTCRVEAPCCAARVPIKTTAPPLAAASAFHLCKIDGLISEVGLLPLPSPDRWPRVLVRQFERHSTRGGGGTQGCSWRNVAICQRRAEAREVWPERRPRTTMFECCLRWSVGRSATTFSIHCNCHANCFYFLVQGHNCKDTEMGLQAKHAGCAGYVVAWP